MITPHFSVTQDDNFVVITIHAPYIRAQDVELDVDGSQFRFYLKPYYLRLQLPGNVIEDARASALYEVESGNMTVKLPKETPGEYFPDLDLLTKLLARSGERASSNGGHLIEVVGENNDVLTDAEIEEAIEYSWELPQKIVDVPEILLNAQYGFNGSYSGYFTHVQETCNEINEIIDPETSTPLSRRQNRIQAEDLKFDEDHYIADLLNNEPILNLLKYKTRWWKILKRLQKSDDVPKDSESTINENEKLHSVKDPEMEFTSREREMMLRLPNKEYLLNDAKAIYLGLVDLLYAYSYNHRFTEGENTIESAWTIGIISPTISSLEQFSTLRETVIALFRRSLSYPLYRSFMLCEKVLQDVYVLLKLGRRAIIKVLLDIKDTFDNHDVYYIYSKVWLDDYCVWCMKASDKHIRSLARELHHFKIEKAEIGFELENLEQISQEAEI